MKVRHGDKVTVRSSWDGDGDGPPTHVLLDVGVLRGDPNEWNGGIEWNCAALTPKQAETIARRLLALAAKCRKGAK